MYQIKTLDHPLRQILLKASVFRQGVFKSNKSSESKWLGFIATHRWYEIMELDPKVFKNCL